MLIFISHSSKTPEAKATLNKLAEEVKDILGYEVWYDPALKEQGGQEWWAEILENIRRCDIFVFALTPQWLASLPCELEYAYANALGKPMLPVMLEKVDEQALSHELQQLQYVDYLPDNDRRLVNLKKSLNNLNRQIKSGQQNILTPEAPLRNTPLVELKSQITQSELEVSLQWQLFGRFKELLLNQQSPNNTIYLLKRFRQQPGLDVTVAHAIDETLENWFDKRQSAPPPRRTPVKGIAVAALVVILLVAGGGLLLSQMGQQTSSTPTANTGGTPQNPVPTDTAHLIPTTVANAGGPVTDTVLPSATLMPTHTPIPPSDTPKPPNTAAPLPTAVRSLISANTEVITADNAWQIRQVGSFQLRKAIEKGTIDVKWSPDGNLIAVAVTGSGVILYDANNLFAEPRVFQPFSLAVSVVFSPDQKNLAIGAWDSPLWIWETATSKYVWNVANDCGGVLAYSPDGEHILGESCDNTLQIWNITTRHVMQRIDAHTKDIMGVAYSPDGKFFVTGSMDRYVKLWNAVSGSVVFIVSGDTFCVTSVAYSPDGRSILAGGCDGKVVKWDATNGDNLFRKNVGGVVYGVAYSPDSRLFVTASSDKQVKIWDAAAGDRLITLYGHTDELRSAVFSPDGRFIATASIDGMVRIWGVPSN
jgi:hypothetical protein